jgi:hypothetical protein
MPAGFLLVTGIGDRVRRRQVRRFVSGRWFVSGR